MRVTLAIALLSGVAAIASSAGAASPVERAARFYAADLERALLQLRTGAALIQARQHHPAQQELIDLLDSLTLFPQRLAADPAQGLKRKRDLERKTSEASAALLREAGAYDVRLFARYGATLLACPDEESARYRESTDELMHVNFAGFQALPDEGRQAQREAVRREEASLHETLRAWPAEDCVAARKLGDHLMQLMFSKLQPWSGEDARVSGQQPGFEFGPAKKASADRADDRDVALAVAGNFVSVVATELELTAYPDSPAGKFAPAP